jgi:hypothetical protein
LALSTCLLQKVKGTVGTAHLPSYNLYIKQFSHKYPWYA